MNTTLRILAMVGIGVAVTACGGTAAVAPSSVAPVATIDVAPTPAPTPPASPAPTPAAPQTARYRVTLQATWSAATHPVDFPAAPHFSPLVGGTHTVAVRFWHEGQPATDGIKNMAERGQTSTLADEIRVAVRSGQAESVFTGSGQFVSPGFGDVVFDVSQSSPLLTLVSMIAPSPDWFVGVSGYPLFQDGRWIDAARIDLDPWDAGTDGGNTFESPDAPQSARLPIARITSAPLSPGGRITPLGQFVIARIP